MKKFKQSVESDYISYYHGMEKLPKAKNVRRLNENGILILAVYFYLLDSIQEFGEYERLIFNEITRNLRTHKPEGGRFNGLFDRGADESKTIPKTKLRTISHDNLSAIAGSSHKYNLPYHRYIYNHGKENQWRFDNVYPESPRWNRLMHPRDIIYWSYLGGGKVARFVAGLFMPLFYLTQIIACFEKYKTRPSLWQRLREKFTNYKYEGGHSKIISTSGQQMFFTRMYPIKDDSLLAGLVYKLGVKIIEWRLGIEFHELFDLYYGGIEGQMFPDHNPDHPIIRVAEMAGEDLR